MSTDYSAMESEVRKLGGIPLKPKALYKELETGCLRAVPDNDNTAKELLKFFNLSQEERDDLGKLARKNFEEKYQWHLSGAKWESYFDSIELPPPNESWMSAPKIRRPEAKPEEIPQNVTHKGLAQWLISSVLCEPEKLDTFFEARLCRDLSYQSSTGTTGGMYYNESSAAFDGAATRNPFNFDMAYDHMKALCERRNHWEQMRMQRIQNTA